MLGYLIELVDSLLGSRLGLMFFFVRRLDLVKVVRHPIVNISRLTRSVRPEDTPHAIRILHTPRPTFTVNAPQKVRKIRIKKAVYTCYVAQF